MATIWEVVRAVTEERQKSGSAREGRRSTTNGKVTCAIRSHADVDLISTTATDMPESDSECIPNVGLCGTMGNSKLSIYI